MGKYRDLIISHVALLLLQSNIAKAVLMFFLAGWPLCRYLKRFTLETENLFFTGSPPHSLQYTPFSSIAEA